MRAYLSRDGWEIIIKGRIRIDVFVEITGLLLDVTEDLLLSGSL